MTDKSDFWTNLSELAIPSPVAGAFVQTRKLGAVAPMSTFGQGDPNAPLLLQQLLFDRADGLETHIRTFAIIDAARLTNFVELLQASDLEHTCLFEGAARAEMAELAPWLVELQPDASATLRLLDDPATPWSIWGKDAAIFVRSTADLTELQRHFRKFTRIRDAEDRWMLLRFWDPNVLLDLALCLKFANAQTFFADYSFIAIIDNIAWQVARTAER